MSRSAEHRYAELVRRAAFDVRLALDVARALKFPEQRRARLARAARELRAEQAEAAAPDISLRHNPAR